MNTETVNDWLEASREFLQRTEEEDAAGKATCSGCFEAECEPCDVGFSR